MAQGKGWRILRLALRGIDRNVARFPRVGMLAQDDMYGEAGCGFARGRAESRRRVCRAVEDASPYGWRGIGTAQGGMPSSRRGIHMWWVDGGTSLRKKAMGHKETSPGRCACEKGQD